MAVSFTDDTWKYVEEMTQKMIDKYTSICTNPDTTYKEVLQAQARIAALKTILNLPQVNNTLAATKRQ